MSQILLKHYKVMEVIVKFLLGLLVLGCMYSIKRCDRAYEPICDMIYLPKTQHHDDQPPILVVVQSVIYNTFMEKLIEYCLSLYQRYQVLPIVLIISVEGYSSKEVKSKFKLIEGVFLMEANSGLWVKRCFVISSESISGFTDEYRLDKLVALASCFIDTDKSSQIDNPAIKYFLNLVNEEE